MSNKVRVRMEIEFDFDPETGEYTPVSRKIIEDKSKVKDNKSEIKLNPNGEPVIELLANKLQLNDSAVSALNAEAEDRLSITYQKVGSVMMPIIATDKVLGTSGGNKLHKNKSISFRGKSNDRLSEYGNTFKLKEKSPGIFIMEGDTPPEQVVDNNIKITESSDVEDLSNVKDLDSSDLEDLDLTEGLDQPTVINFDVKL